MLGYVTDKAISDVKLFQNGVTHVELVDTVSVHGTAVR